MDQIKEWTDYWKGRWARGEIGWHQAEPEPNMVAFFTGKKSLRIFVPLCGKSHDLVWLMSQGHEVVGIEMSELACQTFFEEHKIPFEKEERGASIIYRGPQITLFNQDIFLVTPSTLGKVDAVYDRAALIALPKDLRAKYASHMIGLTRSSDSTLLFCQIVLERTPPDSNGPPFSVSPAELKDLYGPAFDIVLISREVESTNGKARTDECVFQLRPKNP